MADESTFGGGTPGIMAGGNTDFGSGLQFGGGQSADTEPETISAGTPSPVRPSGGFGSGLRSMLGGPNYRAPDPAASALDQTADTLQQRIKRANEVATNPLLQFFNPEGVKAARDFVPAASEKLQQIRVQQAGMAAGKQQAATLGLDPGEVPDEATQADRVEVAKARALRGDLKVFKGLQAVDPKAAEAIQDQVHETVAGHLTKAQFAFDSLAGMQNEGQYAAKVRELRQTGALSDLESLGLKVPQNFDAFNASKAREGQALREARIGVETVRQKLEERNTYQPMEKKEAETYNGRMTTAYGDQITNGTWSRNGASGTRGLVVNGAADPRDLGKTFTLATPEQRKAIKEEFDGAVPKEDVEKYRAFNRTYQMAVTDAKGKPMAEGKINTNPNVQQGIAEGLASMLRGGSGGANVGLLKIELAKRGWAQGAIDGLVSNYAGTMNTLFANADKPYLSAATQKQIRDVMDVLKTYNDRNVADRVTQIAQRAGALGLDSAALGFGKGESAGAVGDALQAGRDAQIARMLPYHQAIGGGDGVFQLGAQRPGAGATSGPPGTANMTQLPGAQPLQTPVQQANNPVGPSTRGSSPTPPTGSSQTPAAAQPSGGPVGGEGPPNVPAPVTVAGQPISVSLPEGASPDFVSRLQRIESGNEKSPWTAGTKLSSASGAFQFTRATWAEDKPVGAPDRAADATPAQQAAALETRTAKNAAALSTKGIPVNDTNLYIAHNLGGTGALRLLQADPNADARTIIGEQAARNNPLFFRGKPTVATVLQRYNDEMNRAPDEGPKPKGGAPGVMARAAEALGNAAVSTLPGGAAAQGARAAFGLLPENVQKQIKSTATEHAPAIGSTIGAVAGSAGGPVGAVAGGSAGGGAGQALKDYLQGNAQSPTAIAKEAALGGVLGVAPEGRPVVGALVRAAGAGGVEAGAEAAKGGAAEDVTEAGLKGAGLAAAGETFGRALGMAGHKVWNLFAPDAKKAVREAATAYHDAQQVLETEAPKLPSIGGVAGGANPKYQAAEAASVKAEKTLVDAGLKPEEAAYAHKVSSEGVPRQEAEVSRPGDLEDQRLGKGYQRLEQAVGKTGVGVPKAAPKLTDGPIAAVENKQVSAKHAELAQHVEMAITAPAASWKEKWVQLKDARSDLLKAERDALSSTESGRTKTAQDMRTLADTVRKQQAKVAEYVFGKEDGPKFMKMLNVLDTRYRNLMEATNGGDLAKAAAMKGEAGREAERKFMVFAHDDPVAQAAYRAMRKGGSNVENDVRTLVGMEKVPYIGHVVTWAKMAGRMREWAQERAAGAPVTFSDMVKLPGFFESNKPVRDLTGTAGARAATM